MAKKVEAMVKKVLLQDRRKSEYIMSYLEKFVKRLSYNAM